MNCYIHQDRTAGNTCSHCGNWICGECTVNVNGQLLCKNCVAEIATKPSHGAPPPPPYGHPAHYGPGYAHGPGRDVNGFLLFLLSFLPGLNYMFMGLMKKGLFYMGSFFLSIYATSFGLPFMGFIMIMIFFVSFFDGFNTRRRIMAGEEVEDGLDELMNFAKRNRTVLILFGCGFVLMALLNRVQRIILSITGRMFHYGFWYEAINFVSGLASLAIIVLGVYIIYKALTKNRAGGPKDEIEVIDYTNREPEDRN